ncbi:MAG: alpha/beta fold hydrolase [Nitriliruptorales bacterium]|nr:alpha/beta fold hydrolase [Nitriliruptorales bacterium]
MVTVHGVNQRRSDGGVVSDQTYIKAQERLLDRFGVEAESRFVDVAAIDGRAHVLVTGEGPPVMMVIGGGPPAAMWAPLMAQLTGFTLYAVDLPGMGLTDPAPYTTETLRALGVDFLDQVVHGLGLDQPVFVAQSMGGLWATWLALDRPGRVPAISYIGCPALMLGTSAPFPIRLSAVPRIGRLLMRLQPPSPALVDRIVTMAGEDFTDLPELRELFLAHQQLPVPGPALHQLHHAAVRLRGARPEVALTSEQLAGLTQPVQLIWGAKDTFGPPEVGRRAAEIIPRAEFHVVPGGHGPWVNQSERVGSIVAPFLQTHSASREGDPAPRTGERARG